ncbi:putative cytosolic protein (plasmid) [Roseomonas mucosa]|nr:plasmid mobilization relaxosome protein MobC [Roseomonas mucosa]UZO95009.1 putative cytosolic protein [Roseomonas mucosa]
MLAEVARIRATSPANWLRSLAITHLARKPQWNASELVELRAVARELASIGNNVNQIARALNVAVHTGQYPPHQGIAAQEAAEAVRYEMRRVAAMITGNFDYWGCPMDERPEPHPDAEARDTKAARAAEKKRKGRPRRRPARFADGEA